MRSHLPTSASSGASGFCNACNRQHNLTSGTSYEKGLDLIQQLTKNGDIDFSPERIENSDFTSTVPLWGQARGKMFGILECLTRDNTPVDLHGFSGQFNGQWYIEGWVPPLFNVDDFHTLNYYREREIKALTLDIENTTAQTPKWLELRKMRKTKSQELMKDIHALYRLTNFKGDTKTLEEVYSGKNNIPTGTGDCCAPKLLNYAARNDLTPTGICEFFYGKETKSGSHKHGEFSSPCIEKCAPILGFMLCGLKG